MDGKWLPMDTAPRNGSCILAICEHDADPYVLDSGKRLTTYGAHCEGMSRVPDGVHVLEWGGEYSENDYEGGISFTIPDWWFRYGSEFEEVANPVAWLPIPGFTVMGDES